MCNFAEYLSVYFVTSFFYGKGFSAPCQTPKLENHPLSVVRGCLIHIFTATLHIWRVTISYLRRTMLHRFGCLVCLYCYVVYHVLYVPCLDFSKQNLTSSCFKQARIYAQQKWRTLFVNY
jgi:hypothetical protein